MLTSEGHEIEKTQPCLLVSPDDMSRNIATVIVAPVTTKSHGYPTRTPWSLREKRGGIVLDQLRTIDKQRVVKTLDVLDSAKNRDVKNVLRGMLAE